MTISPLMSIGATAGGFAAAKVARQIADAATSFVDMLGGGQRSEATQPERDAGEVGTEDLRQSLERTLAEFQQQLQRRLADAGLATTLRFQLQSGRQGGIRVVGEHPDRVRLEQAINDDPQLRAVFHSISATHALIAAAEQYRQISERSWNDPISVAAELGQAASPNGPTFTLTVNGDQIQVDQ